MSGIDWPLTIGVVKDLFVAGAAVTTGVVAVVGLKRWKAEIRGKADFETARELARATYKLRDEIAQCRSAFVRAQEFPEDYLASSKRTPEQEANGWAHVYKHRWAPVWEAIQGFDSRALEAESLWGSNVRKLTDELRACARELNVAIEATIDDKGYGGASFATDAAFAKAMRSTISAVGSDLSNPLTKKVLDCVAAIESSLRPHLSRR